MEAPRRRRRRRRSSSARGCEDLRSREQRLRVLPVVGPGECSTFSVFGVFGFVCWSPISMVSKVLKLRTRGRAKSGWASESRIGNARFRFC